MTGHHVPTFILQDPPKHLDWFYDPQQKHGSWLNVDRSNSLNLTVTDATTSAYSSQTDTTTSWTIGASVTVNVTASAEAGVNGRRRRRGRAQRQRHGRGPVRPQPRLVHREQLVRHAQHQRVDERRRPPRRHRAHLAGLPLPHRQLHAQGHQTGTRCLGPDGQPQYGFYEITLPGATVPFGPGGGRAFGDWYQPLHQNGNALSYPALDAATGLVPLDPGTLGPPVTLAGSDANGDTPPVTLPQPLSTRATSSTPPGPRSRCPSRRPPAAATPPDANGTLSESADVDGGRTGRPTSASPAVSGCADVDVKLNNSNSWGSLKTSSNSTTSTNTFTLQQDAAAQPNWAYGAATAYYTDPAGVYRAAHAVDLLASTDGRAGAGSSTTAGAPTRPSTSPAGW